MQRLEVSGAVRTIYGSLGVKRLIFNKNSVLLAHATTEFHVTVLNQDGQHISFYMCDKLPVYCIEDIKNVAVFYYMLYFPLLSLEFLP